MGREKGNVISFTIIVEEFLNLLNVKYMVECPGAEQCLRNFRAIEFQCDCFIVADQDSVFTLLDAELDLGTFLESRVQGELSDGDLVTCLEQGVRLTAEIEIGCGSSACCKRNDNILVQ